MKLIHGISSIFNSALEAIVPAACEICGKALVDGEEALCLHCLTEMPRTKIHNDRFNTIHQRVAMVGMPIDRAGAYFYYFHDNPFAYMLQKAKYNMRPYLAEHLGQMYAREIIGEGFFDGIDLMVPMPLHWTKLARRGYNQSEMICRGISRVTGIPISDNLKVKRHSTQTRKSATQRQENVKDIFSVHHPEELRNRHVLIVDDIITTGSTLLGAIKAVHATCSPVTVSILTLGCTKLR